MNPSSEEHEEHDFRLGLRVLVVEDSPVCSLIFKKILTKCGYKVTLTSEVDEALSLLRTRKEDFDIVVTDLHIKEVDAFKLLETIGLEMDIPVVMVSDDDDKKMVMKAVEHGACDYLLKPIRELEMQNLWTHVFRKANCENASKECESAEKREREQSEEGNVGAAGNTSSKKPRFNWSVDRHNRFLAAVNEIGFDKAVPSRILEKMSDIEGLTREKVASHLQKYKNTIKKTKYEIDGMVVSSNGVAAHDLVADYQSSNVSYSKLPSTSINRPTTFQRPYPQFFHPGHHTYQKLQAPTYCTSGVNSMEHMGDGLSHNGLAYSAFPIRAMPCDFPGVVQNHNPKNEHARSFDPILDCSPYLQPPPDFSDLLDLSNFPDASCKDLVPSGLISPEMEKVGNADPHEEEIAIPEPFDIPNVDMDIFNDGNMLNDFVVIDGPATNHFEPDSETKFEDDRRSYTAPCG